MRLWTLLFLAVPSVAAQDAQFPAQLELVTPAASCALNLQNDLSFGAVPAALADSLSVLATGPALAGRTPGRFSVLGASSAGYFVEINFPRVLTGTRTPLAFEGTWARAASAHADYNAIAGNVWRGHPAASFEAYFQVGGRVRGLSSTTAAGHYAGKIAITTSCQ